MGEFTGRRNVNRGYMKLEVWNDAVDEFKWVCSLLDDIGPMDFKLRSQTLNAAVSISSNIAEGYCRRSLKEYLQFLNIALGSSGELMTRIICFKAIGAISDRSFEEFDIRHYSTENKLIALKKSLQAKQKEGTWQEQF